VGREWTHGGPVREEVARFIGFVSRLVAHLRSAAGTGQPRCNGAKPTAPESRRQRGTRSASPGWRFGDR
jgi:hypothetical protein